MKFLQDNIVLIAAAFVSGLMLLWPLIARRSAGASVNHVGATRLINDHNATIIDIRPSAEFESGHLVNSKNIPQDDVEKRMGELNKEKPVIVVGDVAQKAAKTATQLRASGFKEVFLLDGGVRAWKEAGLPLVK